MPKATIEARRERLAAARDDGCEHEHRAYLRCSWPRQPFCFGAGAGGGGA
jgi:hypothetical protein